MASKATDPDGLTIKQRAFVQAYVGKANGNGFQAAKMAGYSGNDATVKNYAYKLLQIPKVAAALRGFAAKVEDATVLSVIEVKRILSDIARNPKAEDKDRIAAADKLLKSGGAYSINHNVDVKSAAVKFVFEDNGRGPAPKG